MIRWPLRIAGVCEATFTPATITSRAAAHGTQVLRASDPQVGQQRFEEAHEVPGGVQPRTSSSARTTSAAVYSRNAVARGPAPGPIA